MQQGNGHIQIKLVVPTQMKTLLRHVAAKEQLRSGRFVSMTSMVKKLIIDSARRRRIPIPKGL